MRAARAVAGARARFCAALSGGVLAVSLLSTAAERPPFSVRWCPDPQLPKSTMVEIDGVDAETLLRLERADWPAAGWPKILSVYAGPDGQAANPSRPAMLGRHAVAKENRRIQFRPQFPLEQGVSYRAVFRPDYLPGQEGSAKLAEVSADFKLPPVPEQAATVVSEVYPSGAILPENLLKFYLHFSAPMQRGRIYDHIHLLNEEGKPVELPFLELDEELWNPEMTRLTVFIDPGRIKREVRPLEEIGPALETGKQYSLVIDSAWHDSRGRPLRESFRKSFRVGPPRREPLDPATWKLSAPKAGTRDPLTAKFSGPMDYALALRMIRVADVASAAVDGTSALTEHEARWTFTPKNPWQPGGYQLQVQKIIEDLAGNNIGKAFEVDLFEKVEPRFQNQIVKLPFEVK